MANGIDSGGRGFGKLCLALIPWALGLGAAVWLGLWITFHDFDHQVAQEKHAEAQQQRAAANVGAAEPPKSKIDLKVIPHDCLRITKAELNGDDLLIYSKNECHTNLDYVSWHWQAISPDGTVIRGAYANWECPIPVKPNEVSECHLQITPDDRTATIRVWTQIRP